MAYGLASTREADRVAAVDAVLSLAAAGHLDAAAVGAALPTVLAMPKPPPGTPAEARRLAAVIGGNGE